MKLLSTILFLSCLVAGLSGNVLVTKMEPFPNEHPEAQQMVGDVLVSIELQKQIPFLSLTYGPITINHAYTVQAALDAALQDRLGPVAGYKVAYASRAAQQQFGVDEPARGTYFLTHATPNGSTIKGTSFMEMMLETEVAFTLGESIANPIASVEELKPLVRWIHPALDIGDFRFSRDEGKPTVADMIASGTGAHGFVLGAGRDPASIEPAN